MGSLFSCEFPSAVSVWQKLSEVNISVCRRRIFRLVTFRLVAMRSVWQMLR